jgi:hypothetical protein
MTILGGVLLGGVYVAKRMGLFDVDSAKPEDAGRAADVGRDTQAVASVTVNSRPPRAAIYVCGKSTGKRTTATISVPAGRECDVEVRLRGYVTGKQPILLEAGEKSSLRFKLRRRTKRSHSRAAPSPPAAPSDEAVLTVTSVQVGVVFVNGRRVGKTPRLTLRLAAGTYTVRVRFPQTGVSSKPQEVNLRGGDQRSVHFDAE